MDLAKILPEMTEISSDLKNFAGGFGEKTCQPTCGFQILEVETCRRPSPVLSWSDRMGGSGIDCCWTPPTKVNPFSFSFQK